MTKFSTDWAGAHGAHVLWVSRSGPLAEGANVLRALRAYMVQGLALEAAYISGSSRGFWSIRDNNGVVASSRLDNHLQSCGEHNTSRAHSRSTLSANPSPASLSQHSVMTILFPCGKGRCSSRMAREGIGSLSHLGDGIDGGVGGGKRVGGGGVPLRSRGVGVSRSSWGYPVLWLLWNLLHHLVTTVVSMVLHLREGEENRVENVGEVIPGKSSQELVESSIHQQDKHGGAGNRQGGVEGLGDLYR